VTFQSLVVRSCYRPLGFDMEWRAVFRSNAPERRTALIQICDKHIILLVHISSMKSKPGLVLRIPCYVNAIQDFLRS
jgi:hypothetical protein